MWPKKVFRQSIDWVKNQTISLSISFWLLAGLMLFFSVQNDFQQPLLFLFKSLFLPFSCLYLLLLWAHTLLGVVWKVRYRLFLMFSSIVLTVIFGLNLLPNWHTQSHDKARVDEQGFQVVTFSMMTRSRNGEDVRRLIEHHQPEILCLQEVTATDREMFQHLYPYEAVHGGNLMILSQFPIQNKPVEGADRLTKSSVQAVQLLLPEQRKIEVFNVHMPRQYRVDKYFSRTLKGIALRAESSLPLIFCGDFNSTPRNSLYHYLTQQLGFVDALQNDPWRYGFTFPNSNRRLALFGAWLRIDYLFFRGLLEGTTHTFSASQLSDHKAVMSSFMLPEK